MPLFHSGFLSYALEVITDKTEALTKQLKDLPDESSVEVYLLMKNLALDIISKAAFGYDLKVQEIQWQISKGLFLVILIFFQQENVKY